MKKVTLLFLIFNLAVSAQVFPEYDPTLLKPGMKLAVKDRYQYSGFYEIDDSGEHYKSEGLYTEAALLKGRTFEIIEVKRPDPKQSFYITLKDVNNEELILYKYQPKLVMADFLLLDSINFPDDYFCHYVSNNDEGNLSFADYQGIRFLEYTEKGKPTYTIKLNSESIAKTSNVGTITITFKNGKQIVRKNVTTEQSHASNGKTARYTAILTLTATEATLFKESEIANYDFFSLNKRELDAQTAGIMKGAAECVMNN